jgi:isopenicillin N synthase-like dioxygenase
MFRDLPLDDPDVVAGKPLHGPNQWPSALPELRIAMSDYYRTLSGIAHDLLKIFALGLDLPEDSFSRHFKKPMNQFRVMHYPPQEPTDTSGHVGVRPHTDAGAFTLLYQDPVGGLEILSLDGDWILVPPVPESFVVNIGEMMKVWTDGVFAATPHRVINRSGQERYSMPFFANPDYDAVIAPILKNPAAKDHPHFATSVDRSRPTTSGEILHRVWSRIWPTSRVQRTDSESTREAVPGN